MQRYILDSSGAHVRDYGAWVFYDEAQAEIAKHLGEIARLQAEVERLHHDFVFWRNEADERSKESDSARNDALEEAALEIDCGGQCGACGSHGHCYSDLAATIIALKDTTK